MVQRINNKTVYGCRLCKTIYTKMKTALKCERRCLENKEESRLRREFYNSISKTSEIGK